MNRLLFSILVFWAYQTAAQYQFEGFLAEYGTHQTVYLSLVEDYRKTARIYGNQIIQKTQVDSMGRFEFKGDLLPNDNRIYRIHIDGCNDTQSANKHFLKECHDTQSILFIANNNDTITLPLLQNDQPLCAISSTNEKADLLLQIDALKEEMVFDFVGYEIETSQQLNFKKWFSKLQTFAQNNKEPLAEIYIYDFLSDRKNETHSFYMNDVKSNSYYEELLNRLKTVYGDQAFVTQYENELNADQMIQNGFEKSISNKVLAYFLTGGILLFTLFLVSSSAKNKIETTLPIKTLTSQERTIMVKIAEGKSNKEIAAELFISLSTVKTHINNLYKKLDVGSREELKAMYS
ncbi:LuxR family transcriptional regulator [uncultured Croceitalea sp.]|uniref:helix-turn-helix domain-containing protein n=1 Tax=uncultured Croceitalea sp. TaxID=1798908 RepID=UPI003305F39C